MAIWQYHF